MANWDLYAKRLNIDGNSTRERQINDMKSNINSDFVDSPSYFEVSINSNSTLIGVQIVDNSDSQKIDNISKIIMKPDHTISVGDIVDWNSRKWLVTSADMFSDLYWYGIMQECNNTFSIQTGTTKTLTGYDSLGRPIYSETPVIYETPCITSTSLYSGKDNETAINLPNGQLKISFKHSSTHTIGLGMNFQMYGFTYKIIDLDPTQVISNNGLLSIMAQRQVIQS